MIEVGRVYRLSDKVAPDIRKLLGRDTFTVTAEFACRISDRKLFVSVKETRMKLAEDMLTPQ
jgi:hypothetical protein